ncbi:multidrug resistance protein MdtB, partial [Klebsiella pneumoniae]
RRLRPLAEPGAESSVADARRRPEHPGAVDYPVGLYPERLFPDPG